MNYAILPLCFINAMLGIFVLVKVKDFATDSMGLLKTDFTYIIVGAGTAGSILAARLSETKNDVLLLEAGPKSGIITRAFSNTPLLVPLIIKNDSSILWKYETIYQANASLFMKNQKMILIGGKLLGGTSMINAMISYKPTKEDFDSWNISGWKYKDIDKYLNPEKYCGQRTKPLRQEPRLEVLRRSATFLNGKYENEGTLSFDYPQISYDYYVRRSTYSECLEKIANHKNLHIITDFLVTKINIDDEKSVTSVNGLYRSENVNFRLKKGGKLILSAGAIESAKLLHSSLKYNQIPIGKNLQDHVIFGMFYQLTRSKTISVEDLYHIREVMEYIFLGKGLYSIPSAMVTSGYFTFENSSTPDIQYCIFGIGSLNHSTIKWLSNYEDSIWQKYLPNNQSESASGFLITITLLKPESRGLIKYSSKGTYKIDPKYFSSYKDVLTLKTGVQFITRKIESSKYFQDLGAVPYYPKYSQCPQKDHNFDLYLTCAIQGTSISSYHLAGTNSLGNYHDSNSVLNPDLRVKQTNNLFVIDASVIPRLPTGNPARMITIIAHKGADLVKEMTKISLRQVENNLQTSIIRFIIFKMIIV